MFQLTEELIKESFAQLGIESDFFPVFEKEARSAYEELQRDEPDEETTEYEDTNVCFSIEQAKKYILCYVRELKKGHCNKWADAYTKSSVYWNYSDDDSAHVPRFTTDVLTVENPQTMLTLTHTHPTFMINGVGISMPELTKLQLKMGKKKAMRIILETIVLMQ